MYCFSPSSLNDWEFCSFSCKREMTSFVCLTLKAEEVGDYFFNPETWELIEHCHFPTRFCFLSSFSACVGSVCLMDFSQSLLPALDICKGLLHVAVSWKSVLCSCVQISVLLDGSKPSGFDQKAFPLYLLLAVLIETWIISEHFWSLLHQWGENCWKGRPREIAVSRSWPTQPSIWTSQSSPFRSVDFYL